jgi:two-component system, NtrC family, sensor kinase
MDNQDDRDSRAQPLSPRVLVIDDNDVDRLAVCQALHQSAVAGVVHDTGSAAQAVERIETTQYDCIYIGDSTARAHLFSLLLALNRVGYRGRIEIVAYGVEPAAYGTEAVIDFLAITRLTPERLAAGCRRP